MSSTTDLMVASKQLRSRSDIESLSNVIKCFDNDEIRLGAIPATTLSQHSLTMHSMSCAELMNGVIGIASLPSTKNTVNLDVWFGGRMTGKHFYRALKHYVQTNASSPANKIPGNVTEDIYQVATTLGSILEAQ